MKIPEKARRVFKGEIFEVYQWRQKLYDGSFAIFERLKRPDSISVLPVLNNKIIIALQRQPPNEKFYGLLAGRVDEGEAPLQAARRELLEEAGFASADWELLFKYEVLTKIAWASHIFIARNCRKVTKSHPDPGEKIKLLYLTFKQFLKYVIADKLRDKEVTSFVLRLMATKKLSKFKKKLFG